MILTIKLIIPTIISIGIDEYDCLELGFTRASIHIQNKWSDKESDTNPNINDRPGNIKPMIAQTIVDTANNHFNTLIVDTLLFNSFHLLFFKCIVYSR